MNLLLDTHTFLWFADQQQSANLPLATKGLIEDQQNSVFLSLASAWELAIKVSIGKITLSEPVRALIEFHVTTNDIRLLPLSLPHIDLLEKMPFHHKDPFDRLLIAQAKVESLALVSADKLFDSYGVNRLWPT